MPPDNCATINQTGLPILAEICSGAKSFAPTVSIIIPTYNRAPMLKAALKSVFDQTYSHFEVIVIDDGSTDNTLDMIALYRSRVRFIAQSNRGPAHARNLGIELARGSYVAFLDDDDIWLRRKLERQISVLDTNPLVSLVYGDGYLVRDGNRTLMRETQCATVEWLLAHQAFGPGSVAVRTSVLRTVGGFDPDVVPCEDWDLWLRIALLRKPFAHVDEPVWEYRLHRAAHIGADIDKLYRARVAVLAKFFSSPTVPAELRNRHKHFHMRELVRYGMNLYAAGRFAEARRVLVRAITGDPSLATARPVALILKSLCGRHVLHYGRLLRIWLRRFSAECESAVQETASTIPGERP